MRSLPAAAAAAAAVFAAVAVAPPLTHPPGHLNAHEGHAKCALRNSDCREIFSGVQQGSAMMGRSTDMFQRYHHVFLCGDLNYRLDLGSGAKVAASQKKVAQMAAAGQFSDLWRYDELLREMDAGRTMAGFQTGKCAFPPTYKVRPLFLLPHATARQLDHRSAPSPLVVAAGGAASGHRVQGHAGAVVH